jgi:hypothetical protein
LLTRPPKRSSGSGENDRARPSENGASMARLVLLALAAVAVIRIRV